MKRKGHINFVTFALLSALSFMPSCAMVDVPDGRTVSIPSPTMAEKRKTAINERPDSVMYLPLGEDVLVPEIAESSMFPDEKVGPFELRGETLAGALQLILADYDISIAFETQEGLTRRITVANLHGDLGKVVNQVCSLANLYCSYEDGSIVVKDTQTFTVTLPPLGTGEASSFLEDVSTGLGAILGEDAADPIVDSTTRTIVYSATQRTADVATRYFQRLRANTAMIVFETYIWEVSLNSGNSTGVDWSKLTNIGVYNTALNITGTIGADFTNPVSIGLPTKEDITGDPANIIEFLSQFGAVKTISQPQITVLSGSEAELRVADTQNYVSEIATTLSEGQATTSVNTDSVDTGFTLTIGSSWDKSTVYANVEIELTDVKQIDDFAFSDDIDPADPDATGTQTRIQLPQTSERQLSTQIRARPGDSLLIAGLIRENDNFDERGPGFMEPIIPDSRTAQTQNLELVILLRPRVIVYTASNDKRYVDYAMKKHKLPGTGVEIQSPKELGEPADYTNRYVAPVTKPLVSMEEVPNGVASPLTAEPAESGIGSDPLPIVRAMDARIKATVPIDPEPVQVVPLTQAPVPVTPAPVVTPLMAEPVSPAEPIVVAPVAKPLSAEAPSLADSRAMVSEVVNETPAASPDRFRRGSGFASTGMSPVSPVQDAVAPPSSVSSPVAPSASVPKVSLSLSPSEEDTGNVISEEQPPSYETYDEYSSSP